MRGLGRVAPDIYSTRFDEVMEFANDLANDEQDWFWGALIENRRGWCWAPLRTLPKLCGREAVGGAGSGGYLCPRHLADELQGHMARYEKRLRERLEEEYQEWFDYRRNEWERAQRTYESRMTTYVVEREGWVKIGRTTRLNERVKALGSLKDSTRRPPGMTPGPVTLLVTFGGDLEDTLHRRFFDERVPGTEWFIRSPRISKWLEHVSQGGAA